jgi:hypothetical protein
MHAAGGRDSVTPERLLKAPLLMAFFTFVAKAVLRAMCDNLLFRLTNSTFCQKSGAVDAARRSPSCSSARGSAGVASSGDELGTF